LLLGAAIVIARPGRQRTSYVTVDDLMPRLSVLRFYAGLSYGRTDHLECQSFSEQPFFLFRTREEN